MRVTVLTSVALSLLASCGGNVDASDEASESPTALAAPAAENPAAEAPTGEDTSTEVCGSLQPLLAVLPAEPIDAAMDEIFRGCNQSERGVQLIYATTSGPYTEYEFSVEVIDGTSPLLDTWFTQNGTPESRDALRAQLTDTGNLARVRLDQCRQLHTQPIRADGRNPLIRSSTGGEVCIMDGMTANKEQWFLFTFTPQLRVELEVRGAQAAQVLTSEAAAAAFLPLFARFNIASAPN